MAGEQKSSAAAAALAREARQRDVRLVADMDWLRPARAEPAAIAAFEAVLDRLAAELDATLICAYRRRSFLAAAIGSALAVHSKTRGHDAAPRSSSSPRALGSGGFAARSTSASARWFRPPTLRRLSSETAPSTCTT